MSGLLLHPVPFQEASDFLRDKPLVTRDVFDTLEPELKAYAFTITGIESFDALQNCRDIIAGIPRGRDWEQMKDELEAEISPFLIDPSASHEEQLDQAKAAKARAALLMRLHGFNAYEVAHDEVLGEMQDIFTHLEWQTMGDGRVRPEHAAMNGIIIPAKSKFWTTVWPRRGWGCRCQKIGITGLEAEERIKAEKKLPPEQRMIMTGSALKQLEGGILNRGPNKQFNLGAEDGPSRAFGSMRPPLAELQKRYDPDLYAGFITAMQGIKLGSGDSVADWLAGKDVRRAAPRVVAVSGARTMEDVTTAMDALINDWQQNQADMGDTRTRLADAAADLRRALALKDEDKIAAARAALKALRAEQSAVLASRRALFEQAREAVSVPEDKRGQMRWQRSGAGDQGLRLLQSKGGKLAAQYIHADYLPSIDMRWQDNAKDKRSWFRGDAVMMSHDFDRDQATWNDRMSVVMHEITHGMELQTPKAHAAAQEFLAHRAKGAQPRALKELVPDAGYEPHEVAYEDDWLKRGGSPYTGRKYEGGVGTEILTMGIERLHRDPLGFYSQDREHFEFTVKTLQKL